MNPHERNAHKILSLARLPVPTLPHIAFPWEFFILFPRDNQQYNEVISICQHFFHFLSVYFSNYAGTSDSATTPHLVKTGSVTKEYTIEPASIYTSSTTCTLTPDTCIYDGRPQEPKVTIVNNGKTLVEGRDFTVEYAYNASPGRARASQVLEIIPDILPPPFISAVEISAVATSLFLMSRRFMTAQQKNLMSL